MVREVTAARSGNWTAEMRETTCSMLEISSRGPGRTIEVQDVKEVGAEAVEANEAMSQILWCTELVALWNNSAWGLRGGGLLESLMATF